MWLRDLVENPILEHIASALGEYIADPVEWITAHNTIGRAKRLKLFFKAKCMLIGTSCRKLPELVV